MSEQLSASLSVSFGAENEYFVPSIEFVQDDRNSPPIYLPEIVVAQAQKLPKELEDQAWAQHDKDDPLSASNGGDDPLKLGDTIKINSTIPIALPNDQGGVTEYKTSMLKLARYGAQIVHIFGPLPSAQEKLKVFSKLNQSISAAIGAAGEENASGDYNSRERKSMFDLKDKEGTKGNFNQLSEEKSNCSGYVVNFNFCGRLWRKVFVVPGNRSEYDGEQIQKNGRQNKLIREALHFSGSQEQRIKYWYDHPFVSIVDFADFVNENGNNVGLPSYKGNGKFTTPNPVWGTLIVEYEASYSEFLILYDFPDMKRSYEVMPGSIEKVGYITVTTNDKPVQKKSGEPKPQGYSIRDAGIGFDRQENVSGYIVEDRRGQSNPQTISQGDIGYDRIELDKDWIRKNKDKSDFKTSNCPQVALKLLKKIRFKPFQIKPIEIFYTNGKRAVAATFSPPPPIVLDMPEKELPKVVIFEKRLKSLTASKNWRWDVVEIRILDILGNVTQEKLEMSWKSTWKNSASNPKPEVGP